MRNLVLVAVGVGLLVVGARLLVDAATTIGATFVVSDLVMGLTIVAMGAVLGDPPVSGLPRWQVHLRHHEVGTTTDRSALTA